MRISNSQEPISRVKCIVNTCGHYMNGDYCTAERIEVQPKNANNTDETDCATFEPKG